MKSWNTNRLTEGLMPWRLIKSLKKLQSVTFSSNYTLHKSKLLSALFIFFVLKTDDISDGYRTAIFMLSARRSRVKTLCVSAIWGQGRIRVEFHCFLLFKVAEGVGRQQIEFTTSKVIAGASCAFNSKYQTILLNLISFQVLLFFKSPTRQPILFWCQAGICAKL